MKHFVGGGPSGDFATGESSLGSRNWRFSVAETGFNPPQSSRSLATNNLVHKSVKVKSSRTSVIIDIFIQIIMRPVSVGLFRSSQFRSRSDLVLGPYILAPRSYVVLFGIHTVDSSGGIVTIRCDIVTDREYIVIRHTARRDSGSGVPGLAHRQPFGSNFCYGSGKRHSQPRDRRRDIDQADERNPRRAPPRASLSG